MPLPTTCLMLQVDSRISDLLAFSKTCPYLYPVGQFLWSLWFLSSVSILRTTNRMKSSSACKVGSMASLGISSLKLTDAEMFSWIKERRWYHILAHRHQGKPSKPVIKSFFNPSNISIHIHGSYDLWKMYPQYLSVYLVKGMWGVVYLGFVKENSW